ncbi:MAG: thiamine pyrophosphate-dependent enzyme [Bacteroidia bacterium]|nr:thiamine pyrophosphate-dependent enzyme [Bacteroidia bacterium]
MQATDSTLSFEEFKKEVLEDYKWAVKSRHASLIGRKEVLTGKAKFGIFGDGKEVPQIAMAKVFNKGDFRSGYYRDQTFMFAKGINTVKQFFAQLYAHPDIEADPNSGGRSMNGHFASQFLDENGQWLSQTDKYNVSADISPTGGQMPRLLGLAYASKIYRQNPKLKDRTDFSINGNEIAFGTIGNASTSEGGFWEVMNAAGVMQVPMLMSIWDDQYGISVPAKYQTTKEDLSALLSGFVTDGDKKGIRLFTVKGWDYAALCKVYEEAAAVCRSEHTPVVVHVTELTQPQGHSTSGSHERYKSKERLAWEAEYDCNLQMRKWMISNGIATEEEVLKVEDDALEFVKNQKDEAWKEFMDSMNQDKNTAIELLQNLASDYAPAADLANELKADKNAIRKETLTAVHQALRGTHLQKVQTNARQSLLDFYHKIIAQNKERYSSNLYSQSDSNVFNQEIIPAEYSDNSPLLDGREIVNACFDKNLEKYPEFIAFGEDVGKIGDVNQGFAGLQDKYGELRVSDVGIRELSIVGQGLGAAMRGLRPIAEIQYLDYLLYALEIMSDDIATVQYRTVGRQKAPVIVRTRGHRLEGIWHSGSYMAGIIHLVRGMHVCVPRNMVQAAGMYNLLFKSDEPALVVECLNGYRLKEKLPDNIGEFTVPFGVPEILHEGTDVTIVCYGSSLRIAQEGIKQLAEFGISVELIDVQTLLPFDIHHSIAASVKKTNKVVFMDEDVPGGTTSFMMQQVLEVQQAFQYLDAEPVTITAKEHRPAYGSDGDYFSKCNAEDVFNTIYTMMHNYNPEKYPAFGV